MRRKTREGGEKGGGGGIVEKKIRGRLCEKANPVIKKRHNTQAIRIQDGNYAGNIIIKVMRYR